jgi:phytoene dehydrogenase-like protein
VIIGAGLGGLFAGARLAKAGKNVRVLEQHSVPGGYAASFKRGRFVFEAGLHVIDGFFDPQNPNLRVFEDLGVFDAIEVIRVPEFYSVLRDDLSFSVPDDIDAYNAALNERFPDERDAIQKILGVIRRIRDQVLTFPQTRGKMLLHLPLAPFKYRDLLRYLRATVGGFLEPLTDNEDLKLILTANTGYYHDDPFRYSMLHFGAAQGSYLCGGGAYFKGGSQKLARYLMQYIRDRGGEVSLNTTAEKVLVRNNRVVAVRCRVKGAATGETLDTDFVVANCSIPGLFDGLLQGDVPDRIRKRFRGLEISHSIFGAYYGLKGPATDVGLDGYTTFLLPEGLRKLTDLARSNTADDFEQRVLAVVNYGRIGAGIDAEGAETVSCHVIDRIGAWEGLSREDYKQRKAHIADVVTARIEAEFPGFSDLIEVREIATPTTMRRYTQNPEGAIYGYAQTPAQVGMGRPEWYSGIKGLYFASAWTKPGGGMSPSSKAGFTAAEMILDKCG